MALPIIQGISPGMIVQKELDDIDLNNQGCRKVIGRLDGGYLKPVEVTTFLTFLIFAKYSCLATV